MTKTASKRTAPAELHTIDATGRPLGRLASDIAHLLQGKHRPDYAPYIDFHIKVEITNAKNLAITGKKMTQKVYRKYSGYPGGLKEVKLKDIFPSNPKSVILKAVNNMLPKNRLRNPRLRRITIS